MGVFDSFINTGMKRALKTVGELATIGADTFEASFDELDMIVGVNPYGDTDEATTKATCIKSDLSAKPSIRSQLTRNGTGDVYVVLSVQEDTETYEIGLRLKDG